MNFSQKPRSLELFFVTLFWFKPKESKNWLKKGSRPFCKGFNQQ
jgi:hypothetical protein